VAEIGIPGIYFRWVSEYRPLMLLDATRIEMGQRLAIKNLDTKSAEDDLRRFGFAT